MNRIALWLSSAFWLLMMGLLFKVDILPGYIVDDSPGYESLIRDVEAPIIRTMAVLQDGVEVGTSQTVISPEPDGTFSIANVTSLTVKVGFLESTVSARLNVTLDVEKQLDELFLVVDLGAGKRAEVTGRREGEDLDIKVSIGGETFNERLPYDNDVISSYFNPFPMGSRLREGQQWKTKFLDPLSGQTKGVTIKVVGRETIELTVRPDRPPVRFNAFKVVTEYDGNTLNAWATEDGVVLKEETPLGYTLVYREDAGDDQS